MSSRTAKMLISILMLASLLILILSSAGLLGQSAGPASQLTSPSGGSANQTVPSGTTAAVLEPLTLDLAEPEPTPALGMRRWPAESCLALVHQPDLESYLGHSEAKQPLQGITVILDPGHGGQDGGTSYPADSASPQIVEKDVTLAVSLKVKALLTDLGANVIMTREQDDWVSVYKRIALASRYVLNEFIAELPYHGYDSTAVDHLLPQLDDMIDINSDTAESGGRGLLKGVGATSDARLILDIQHQYADTLFLSMHCNALSDGSEAGGLQVYYQTSQSNYEKETSYVQYQDSRGQPPAYTLYDDTGRLKLAEAMRDSILVQVPALKYRGNSDVLTGDYAVLRELNLVSVLVEMGFVTSPSDREILLDPAGQQKIAQGTADAVLAYYCG